MTVITAAQCQQAADLLVDREEALEPPPSAAEPAKEPA